MQARIRRASRFSGAVAMPGDKSIGHRAVLFGALARGVTRIENLGLGQDVRSSLSCVGSLGVKVSGEAGVYVLESPGRDGWRKGTIAFDAGNSGTTARLMMGMLAPCDGLEARINGDASLCARPMRRVSKPLAELGAAIKLSENGTLPAAVHGGRLLGRSLHVEVPSAQVKSAVLLAALGAEGETWITGTGGRDHTERMLPLFGAEVRRDPVRGLGVRRTHLAAPSGMLRVPGDPSSAMFFAVAAAICGGDVSVADVCLNPSRTAGFQALRQMGACCDETLVEGGVDLAGSLVCHGPLTQSADLEFDAAEAIDEVPVLAVAAALRPAGSTTFRNAAELRVKESDRLNAVVGGLRAMGADVDEQADAFTVRAGRPLHGAHIDARGDHRIAMAFAVAGLAASGETLVDGAEWAAISFPAFFGELARLSGGAMEVS